LPFLFDSDRTAPESSKGQFQLPQARKVSPRGGCASPSPGVSSFTLVKVFVNIVNFVIIVIAVIVVVTVKLKFSP
jgi:hypothetical protein